MIFHLVTVMNTNNLKTYRANYYTAALTLETSASVFC